MKNFDFKRIKLCAILLFTIILHVSLKSQSHLSFHTAPIFTDNMVLQQGKNVPVWGTGVSTQKVIVEINGITANAIVDDKGNWITYLPVLDYGGPYELKIKSQDSIVYKNVMVGEVWFAAGQSNMGITVSDEDSSIFKHNEDIPNIREFTVPSQVSNYPITTIDNAEWKTATVKNIQNFSAVAFYFAKNLSLDKKIAVGIIRSAWGGTRIEAWISRDMMLTDSFYRNEITHQHDSSNWYTL